MSSNYNKYFLKILNEVKYYEISYKYLKDLLS